MKKLTHKLKKLRLDAGLTQSSLAYKMGDGGNNKSFVSKVENGKLLPTLPSIAKWAEVCGYEVEVRFNARKHKTLE